MDTARVDPVVAAPAPPTAEAPEPAPLLRHPAPVAVVAVGFAVLAFASHRPGATATIAAFLAAVLVVLAATDIERRVIPNRVVLPAVTITLAAHAALDPRMSIKFALAAIAAGTAFLIPGLLRRSWIGMGDVKFIVLLGAGLGWGVLAAVTIAFLSLFPVALATLLRRGLAARKATLPLGPFLALGGLIMLIGPHL
jgi:leader peptidase (prepilin peptidase)/N-methyltransferase